MIGSALIAWRRSPLYSNKTTMKLLGVVMLIAAAVVGLIVTLSLGTQHLSEVGQGIVAVVAILVVTTGSSILLIRVADSHVAQLPPSTSVMSVHRHRVLRWVWRFLIFELMCSAAGWTLPEPWRWLPIGVAGLLLILSGPTLAIFYTMARRNDRSLAAVMAAPWVHWRFSAEEWGAWAESQRIRELALRTNAGLKVSVSMVLVCGGLFAVGAAFAGDTLREKVSIVAGLTGLMALMVAAAFAFDRTAAGRHYRRVVSSPPEIYLGEEGVYYEGSFTPWVSSGKYLIEATSTRIAPACIALDFQSFIGGSSRLISLCLPMPSGSFPELATIQAQLGVRCPNASVHLLD
jgi:hypothetical protein